MHGTPEDDLQAAPGAPAADDMPAPSPDRARDAWDAANSYQKDLEAQMPRMQLPAPEMENYGAQRLAQVSDVSRRMSSGYNELFRRVRC